MTTDAPFSVDQALAHLSGIDPRLSIVIENVGPYRIQRRPDPYASLLRTILFQQLAGAAAAAIERRFLGHYGSDGQPPAPEQLLATTDEEFRAMGLSRQKIGYMRDLALHIADHRVDLAGLAALPDEEVTKSLIAVKGLGEWSAHMFLMFHLGRPDVLPVGDLGVRHGMRLTYGLEEIPTPARAREIGAPWAPYRSVGSWYMWRVNEATAPFV